MPVAFTPTTVIQRSSQFTHDMNTRYDEMDDGEPRGRSFGSEEFTTINCHFHFMTKAERDTLMTFLTTNKAAVDITWTVDGIDYEGYFKSKFKQSFVGNLYNVTIMYRAKEV